MNVVRLCMVIGPGQAYVAKRIAAGDDKTEAL